MNLEISVIRRQESVAAGAPPSVTAVAAFAQGHAAQYSSRAIAASGADLALAWESPAEVHHHYSSRTAWALPAVSVEESYVIPTVPRLMPIGRSDGPRYGDAEAAALFGRLFSRRLRSSSVEPPGGPVFTAAARIQAPARADIEPSAPLERVLARPQAAVKSQAPPAYPEPSGPAAPDAGWGTPLAPRQTAPVTLAPPEIRRVADQVMREIDHRVTARRERTGRR